MDLKSQEDSLNEQFLLLPEGLHVNSDSQKNIYFNLLRKLIWEEGKVACKKSLKIESKEIAYKAL